MERDKLIETWFENVQSMQRGWKSQFHGEMIGEKLTIGQLGMLLYLQNNQPVSSKQVAATMCLTKGAVAQFIESLDQLGLIVREPDPADRRIVYISLSESGEAKAKALHERRKAFFTKLASVMDDDELRTMINIHKKMIRQIEQEQGQGQAEARSQEQAQEQKKEQK